LHTRTHYTPRSVGLPFTRSFYTPRLRLRLVYVHAFTHARAAVLRTSFDCTHTPTARTAPRTSLYALRTAHAPRAARTRAAFTRTARFARLLALVCVLAAPATFTHRTAFLTGHWVLHLRTHGSAHSFAFACLFHCTLTCTHHTHRFLHLVLLVLVCLHSPRVRSHTALLHSHLDACACTTRLHCLHYAHTLARTTFAGSLHARTSCFHITRTVRTVYALSCTARALSLPHTTPFTSGLLHTRSHTHSPHCTFHTPHTTLHTVYCYTPLHHTTWFVLCHWLAGTAHHTVFWFLPTPHHGCTTTHTTHLPTPRTVLTPTTTSTPT